MTLKSLVLLLLALAALAHAQPGPYADQQSRDIKALSPEETASLLGGEGMGYAKPAELNGYPGPTHVLALAGQLRLSTDQIEASRLLMAQHKAQARRLGAEIVERERALDRAFASHQADSAMVQSLTREIGALQAELRAEHLNTHLKQTALLSSAQVEQYAQLRGYAAAVHHHAH